VGHDPIFNSKHSAGDSRVKVGNEIMMIIHVAQSNRVGVAECTCTTKAANG